MNNSVLSVQCVTSSVGSSVPCAGARSREQAVSVTAESTAAQISRVGLIRASPSRLRIRAQFPPVGQQGRALPGARAQTCQSGTHPIVPGCCARRRRS